MNDTVFRRYSIAIVTPFEDTIDQNIDEAGVVSVVDHTCRGLAALRQKSDQVGGIIVSGSTGEQHSMTTEERIHLYQLAITEARKFDVPVACGVAATTTKAARQLAAGAVAAGAAGIMLGMPPYCRCDDEELSSYVEGVKEVLPPTMPVLLYNNAVRNGYGPSPETLVSWFQRGLIIGVKYAVFPHAVAMTNSQRILDLEPDMRLYTGSDALFLELIGPNGFGTASELTASDVESKKIYRYYGLTSIVGNIFPEYMGEAIVNLAAGSVASTPAQAEISYAAGNSIHAKLSPLIQSVIVNITIPVGVKYAMNLLNVRAGVGRRPVGRLSDVKQLEIEAALASVKDLSSL